jgi:predicted NAD/FAD-binding protein
VTKLAIIGTGIAGMGCAHFLHTRHELSLFEQNGYVGGHTNTVTVDADGAPVPVDTGFMVFNQVTYPNLTRLFNELGVAVKPTNMSFSVQHLPTRLEFCGSSLNHLFAQRKNLFRPRFWKMIWQINRFNAEAVETLKSSAYDAHSVAQYVREKNYGDDFLNFYLVPMSSAVWSTPPDLMLQFPAITLLRFFHNHGFLGLHTQHPWFTVVNGAKSYVAKITAPFRDRIRLKRKAVKAVRENGRVKITTEDGASEVFDKVIFACHGDQALQILADADAPEKELLGAFKYQSNLATLHTDEAVMPKAKRCWASWNYRIAADADGKISPSTIYWMNRLQGISGPQNYFVSINGAEDIHPDHVLKRIQYEHPLFNLEAMAAQKELPALNQRKTNVYFCGSYFKYGFHEDAFASALELCRMLTGERIWA